MISSKIFAEGKSTITTRENYQTDGPRFDLGLGERDECVVDPFRHVHRYALLDEGLTRNW